MYNKILSLLILLAIFWWIYYFFYYFFVLNKWNLTINSNVDNYKVTMYSKKLKTSFSSECKSKKCELIDLAPFDYELTLEKEWYKPYKKNLKVQSKSTIDLDITLEKQISIKKVKSTSKKQEYKKENQLDKFREISELQKSYKYFNLGDMGYFYFVKNDNKTIDLFNKNGEIKNKIISFNDISADKLDIQKIYSSDNLILIVNWDDKNIFDLKSWIMTTVFFPQKVNYVKRNMNLYYFVNDKWTFIYDLNTTKIEYFYIFKDFVNYDRENYFWVIYKDEKDKKKNYNLEDNGENLIVKYNFITKEMKILETTTQDISKIVWEDNNIYFYDNNNEKYLVDNIE